MAELAITPEELRRLARLVEENGLSELRYEQGDLRVTLRTAAYRQDQMPPAPVILGTPTAVNAHEDILSAAHDDGFVDSGEGGESDGESGAGGAAAALLRVEAPIMGVFYRRSSPDAPPFVEVGDTVEVGQVIGIIEAMKVFSEVPSEVAGRIVEIPVLHGGLVQPGDALALLSSEESVG